MATQPGYDSGAVARHLAKFNNSDEIRTWQSRHKSAPSPALFLSRLLGSNAVQLGQQNMLHVRESLRKELTSQDNVQGAIETYQLAHKSCDLVIQYKGQRVASAWALVYETARFQRLVESLLREHTKGNAGTIGAKSHCAAKIDVE